MAEDAGFLSRWSRRKVQVREGIAVPAVPPAAPVEAPPAAKVVAPAPAAVAEPAPAVADLPPPPTLEDVAALTRESDYTRFVARDVSPDVKNAALKKLFGDPHFNVMDGLDTYIDDYGKPDPLPMSKLRQMVQAQALRLFDDDDEAQQPAAASATATAAPPSSDPPPHEDTDLRLQPHDAAGRPGPEPGAGEDIGREH
jgi:Protein of unknown function (DUF3306)